MKKSNKNIAIARTNAAGQTAVTCQWVKLFCLKYIQLYFNLTRTKPFHEIGSNMKISKREICSTCNMKISKRSHLKTTALPVSA